MKCKPHGKYNCMDSKCRRKREEENSSSYQMTEPSVIVNSEGHIATSIGGGFYVDTQDGSTSYGSVDSY